MAAKLKALEGILKVWNKEVFGNVGNQKAEALPRVNFWDTRRKRDLSLAESEESLKAREDYQELGPFVGSLEKSKSREV